MEDKNLTGRESWLLIQQMIQSAKEDHHETGSGWLIWGWLLFLASVLSLILSYTPYREYISYVWSGMLVLGALLFTISRVKQKDQKVVKTYVKELLEKFSTGFFISLFVLVGASFVTHAVSFGYFFILYAFWMFIYGSALRFKPLLVGAAVNWAAAVAIIAVPDFRIDMVISAVAVFVGYLVPGYLLRAKYRKVIPS